MRRLPYQPERPTQGVLAIVGRPNVGKSTLFNRLVGGRPALVHDTPGVTRDRRYGFMDYDGRHIRVIDTGGLDPDARHEAIGAGIHRQAETAMSEADAVIFVLDAMTGTTPIDRELAQKLRKLGRPVYLELWVKTLPGWRRKRADLGRLGFRVPEEPR